MKVESSESWWNMNWRDISSVRLLETVSLRKWHFEGEGESSTLFTMLVFRHFYFIYRNTDTYCFTICLFSITLLM